MNLISKTSYTLFITGIICFILSFIIPKDYSSIKLFDTYFSIFNSDFLKIYAVILIVFGAAYKLLNKYLRSGLLNWIHVIFTIFLPLITLWINYSYHKSLALIETSSTGASTYFSQTERTIYIIILCFLCVQSLPVLQIARHFLKRG